MIADMDIMNRGLTCLIRELGIVEAEIFISFIKNDNFDYTKWRANQFDELTLAELNQKAADYDQTHPFTGNAEIL